MNRRKFISQVASGGATLAAGVTGAGGLTAESGAAGLASSCGSRHSATQSDEAPLDPLRPVVDPHHHLFGLPPGAGATPYLLDDFLADVKGSGHNVLQTVFVECNTMYRTDGPEEMRSVGQTEFANGMAAMSASGLYGPTRVAAGIVGTADFRLGEDVGRVLDAQIAAGNGRLRSIRTLTVWAEVPIFGMKLDPGLKGIMSDPAFRLGVASLAPRNLNLDVWCFHTQLSELVDLASSAPNTNIILNHLGTPLSVGTYSGREKEVFMVWRKGIVALARRSNVTVKLGGLGMDLSQPLGYRKARTHSEELAVRWRPYIETCIESFGPLRCMFESNFPPDAASCSYGALWNVFKRLSAGLSEDEREALFRGTAQRVYRLDGGLSPNSASVPQQYT